jgi:DNA-binding LytR/AlgR family response regulator
MLQFFETNFKGEYNILDNYFSGQSLLADIKDGDPIYDFIFLDLDMPKIDGIHTGNALRKIPAYENSIIIFITSYDCNPAPIVDIHPYAYIKKPVDFDILKDKMSEALARYYNDAKYIVIPNSKNTLRLNARELLYVASQNRVSVFHTLTGNIALHMSLGEIEDAIRKQSNLFVRTHASYLINMNHIAKVTPTSVCMKNMDSLPLTRTYKTEFFERFNELLVP